jgi:hypothetical protein
VAAGAVAWVVGSLLAGGPRPVPEPETNEDERSGAV